MQRRLFRNRDVGEGRRIGLLAAGLRPSLISAMVTVGTEGWGGWMDRQLIERPQLQRALITRADVLHVSQADARIMGGVCWVDGR